MTAGVSGWANGGTCASADCDLYLEFVLADGSGNVSAPITGMSGSGLDPYSYDYTGTFDVAAVSGVSLYVSDHHSYDTALSSAVAPITTDTYPTSANASLIVHSIGRLPGGLLSYDVTADVNGWRHSAACVHNSCQVVLDFVTADGSDYPNQSLVYPSGTDPYSGTFTGSLGAGAVTGAYLTVTDDNGYDTPFRSPVIPVNGALASEKIGGSNPSTKSCSCTGGDPVDTESGEFYQNDTDLLIPGTGPRFDVARSYSSEDAAAAGSFGYGWTSDMDTHMVFGTPNSAGMPVSVEVIQANGSTVTFYLNSSNQYVPPPWVLAALTYSAPTGQWTLVRRAAETLMFDSAGYLASDSNPQGVATSYVRNSSHQVTSETASGGRSFTFSWVSSHVSGVTDSAGRTVTYGYNASNELTSVTDPVGNTTHYSYAAGHFLATFEMPNGGTTTNTYNTDHQVTTQTDPLSRATTFSYSGTATTVTAPGGAETVDTYSAGALISEVRGYGTASATTTTHTYDGAGNMLSTTDGLGNMTAYTYDPNGNELTKTDPLGKVSTYTYNAFNEVTSSTSPLGRETTATYDSSGNKLTTTSPGGSEQQWTYNTDGTPATSVDPRGKTTSYAYNTAGDLTSTTDPDGRVKSVAYNSAGFPTSSTDAAGKVTTYTVDALGRPLTSTDPNSHTTTNTYDADGNLLTTEDPNSHTASKAYDLADEVTSSTDARGKVTTYTYTAAGQPHTSSDPDSHTTTSSYNPLGELTSVQDADSRTTTYTYDADGRKLSTTSPSGAISSSLYDADGRVTSTTDAKGKVTSMAYDADGELVSSSDPLARATSTSYTADGQVHVVTLPDSSSETYAYNPNGQTTEFTNADGKNTTYSYDDADVLTSKVEPGGLETGYAYDAAGRLSVVTLPDLSTETDSYDDAGQLTRAHSSVTGSTDITYTYSDAGQRATMTDQTGTTSYAYNQNGQPVSVVNGAGATVVYGYDDAGRTTSIVYPGSRIVAYSYDAAGQMASLTDWASNETDFTWTADGQLSTQADPNGVTETRSYDANDQTTGVADTHSGTALADYTYGYDDAGDVSSDGTTDAGGTVSHSYAYDPNSQLTTVTTAGASPAYAASSAGELTTDTNGNTLGYNAGQELTSLTPTAGAEATYAYDGNGSRTASTVAASGSTPAATTSYTFDPAGDLASVTPSSGPSVGYVSDGDGLRQSRSVGSATADFTWDVSGSLPLLLDDGTHSYLYGPSSAPLAQVDDSTGAIQYLHGDLVGSTRMITDASGTVVGTTEYDSYGNPTSHTGTADSAIGYSGNWTDPATGLVYLRARDYDPATAQFLTVDPDVDTTRQPYTYTANNPLLLTDPTGLCVGMDGTPQDRPCTYTDFYWSGFLPTVSTYASAGFVGFVDGLTFDQAAKLAPGETCQAKRNSQQSYDWGHSWGQLIDIAILALLSRGKSADEPATPPRGSSGRSEPVNLKEQLAMEEVQSDPAAGKVLSNIKMTDPRWPASDGWVKMSKNVNGVEIHYVRNLITGAVDDFKFK